jgi:predicted dehydrogenase
VQPARTLAGVQVDSVAARSSARATAFAKKHAIPRWSQEYAALVADSSLDAIYIPLPNGLHFVWALRALAAGKHVLCEKPLAANAVQAEQLVTAAATSGRVLMEAFHNRYHPLLLRVGEIVHSGEIGRVVDVEAIFRTPSLRRSDIRYDYMLAGGATMDMGCYMVNLMRYVVGEEPVVTDAQARLLAPDVDRRMQATLRFPSGATGRMDVEMKAMRAPDVRLIVQGEKGSLQVVNPVLPHLFHCLRVETRGRVHKEHFGHRPSYVYQLAAFAEAIRTRMPFATDAPDALRTLRVIDAIYTQAGLRVRGQDDAGEAHP